MSVATSTPDSSASSHSHRPSQGFATELKGLNAIVQQCDNAAAGLACLRRLSENIDQLCAEHGGMAEELLSIYEQLGIVFEVTRRLSEVQDERAVLDLFQDCIANSFQHYRVSMLVPGAGGYWSAHGVDIQITPWLAQHLDSAMLDPQVVVASPTEQAKEKAIEDYMIAPALCDDQYVCAIILARPTGVPEFRAGEMSLVESLAQFCGDVIRNHRLLDEVRQMSVAMVLALVNAVDQKDPYTSGHSLRVAYYATMLGKELFLVEGELQMLQWSALLHDVGKIGIRDDVLKKEGKLTDDEMAHMREHPVRSYDVVKSIPRLRGALDGVLFHHERYDGSGYPQGLCNQDIPFQARIIQIADVFDALTSTRSYRPAFGWQKALQIMNEEAGTTLDPHLQHVFDRLVRERLEDDEGAWEKMIEAGNDFTSDWPHIVNEASGV